MPKPRTPEEIQADLDLTRERLVSNVSELAGQLEPKAIAKKASDQAKEGVDNKVKSLKRSAGLQVEGEPAPDGPSPQFIGAVAGVGVAIVILVVLSRRRR